MAELGNSTKALHAGHRFDPTTNSVAVPIYQTTSYAFNDTEHAANLFGLREFGNIYTRLMNPTNDAFEKRIAAMEGGTGALATSSGMSAIFLAVTTVAKAGDHIISASSLYGGTETLFRHTLPKFGIEVTFLNEVTPETVKAAVKENTRLVYCETIGNPKGDILDLEALTAAAHAEGLPVMIDNTFAPSICRPFDFGVDIVVYSCTKWIGGHGTSLGGVIVDSGNFNWGQGRHPEFTTPDESYHGLVYWEALGNVPGMGNVAFILKARVEGLRNIGMSQSPFNSFQLIQGIETLTLRVKKHGENALALAKWLKEHPLVEWVNYTGLEEHPSHENAQKYLTGSFGSVFGFGVKGGQAAAEKFINSVELCYHLANVGDARTLVIHPASTTHAQLSEEAQKACGIEPDFVRISVGIEDLEDIKADIDQALKKSQS